MTVQYSKDQLVKAARSICMLISVNLTKEQKERVRSFGSEFLQILEGVAETIAKEQNDPDLRKHTYPDCSDSEGASNCFVIDSWGGFKSPEPLVKLWKEFFVNNSSIKCPRTGWLIRIDGMETSEAVYVAQGRYQPEVEFEVFLADQKQRAAAGKKRRPTGLFSDPSKDDVAKDAAAAAPPAPTQ